MQNSDDKPTVRVVKAHLRQKSGVIRVEGDNGKVYYKGPCDRCGDLAQTTFLPKADRELTCKSCRWISEKAKPSTKLRRKGDKVLYYLTDCDMCGDRQKTPFMPKRDRDFLCDLCYQEENKDAIAEREAKKTADAAARSETAAEAAAEPGDATDAAPRPTAENGETAAPAGPSAPARDAAERKPVNITYYDVYCRKCKQTHKLRFRPERGESFVCKDCYIAEKDREEAREGKPSTRGFFNIECVACGKVEMVHFVPKDLAEPMCTACFSNNKRRRT